ncbi:DUF4064 domain-containing protein [Ureibacillus sp. Re31]|uniref:DUF4064 domain-containing protein n=1 Tax=Ureibacillus galli TaxID=2762222 RepID=A0ABR8XA18_9BACL|nr:DUF4064 domain-containing protein [Ureibacillus galli]MBD8026155.1 DUF4064 domain-containing protein [Ureibacillus galli]
MKRTGERILSIVSAVLNLIGVGFLIFMLFISKMIVEDPAFQTEFENSIYEDASINGYDPVYGMEIMDDVMALINTIGWLVVVVAIIAIVLAVVGAVKVNQNAKLAGILFIIAAVLSGIVSISGILLIIAAIMCFVRKPKTFEYDEQRDENGYIID